MDESGPGGDGDPLGRGGGGPQSARGEASDPDEGDGGAGGNPYLSGNFAPVTAELAVENPLPVDGTIPPTLEGMYLRNGPNPAAVPDPTSYHWSEGHGMVHAVGIRNGTAVSYRNRWVRTRKLAAEIGSVAPPGPAEPLDGPVNANVVWHAGRLMALGGSGFPHLITPDLDTLRIEDFDAMLASPMGAHPHVDPVTGSLAFVGADPWGPPFLRYHELDAAGRLVHSTSVDVPRATLHHDVAVTASRVAFLDLPVVHDSGPASHGAGVPYHWDPESPARIGVLDRGDAGSMTRWIDIDPCFVSHVMNAFDDGGTVVLDVCRYARMFDTAPGGPMNAYPARLERWRVDPVEGTFRSDPVDDRPVELPRIDASRAGRPYRFGYCVETSRSDGIDIPQALLRHDFLHGRTERWDPGAGRSPGEPVVVRAEGGRAEDDGWVLSLVYDARRDASDLVVIDASRFGEHPDAVIHLPARVPFGFHGTWLPAALAW